MHLYSYIVILYYSMIYEDIKRYISTINIQSIAKHVTSYESELAPSTCTFSCSN
jgi:hypothetical protein